MAWDGLYYLDGQEFINVARTEAYAASADAHWIKPIHEVPHLADMLGDVPYVSPAIDPAPWYDPEVPESADFYGLYPLDVSGIDDSSRASSIVESTIDGGVPGRLRHASKTVVFSVALVGGSEKAVDYGAKWLRRTLLGDLCVGDRADHGLGTTLEFLSSRPNLDPNPTVGPQETLSGLTRTLRRFSVNSGPSITAKRTIESCGGEVWTATFSGIAGNPFIFAAEQPILQGWLSGAVGTEVVRNRLPDSSFEDQSVEWLASGPATVAFVEDLMAPHGVLAAELTATGSGDVYLYNSGGLRITVAPEEVGQYVTLMTNVAWSSENPAKQVELQLIFFDSGMNQIFSITDAPFTPGETYGFHSTVSNDITTNTAFIEVRHRILSAVAGDSIRVDAVMVPIGAEVPIGGPYPEWTPYTAVVVNPEPWVPGVTPGTLDNYPTVFDEVECGDDVWEPIYDPLCPALIVPPTPPDIPLGCFTPPAQWDRRAVTIPGENMPTWDDMVPIVHLTAIDVVRNARLRFYEDPDGVVDPIASPCSWSQDLVISYIPAGAVMVIDAAAEAVWVETGGTRRRADSLIFTTEGRPFDWPSMLCGHQHLITLDTEVGTTPPVVDLSLVAKVV